MASLNLASYRFSVSWPRVIPGGSGPVNQAGLDFYARLVDGLLERGISPQLTLYHWDLPQSLQNSGGWTRRETVDHFVEFAIAVGAALGDRVPGITTLNEPFCAAFLGYASGVHAPGETEPARRAGGGASPEPRTRPGGQRAAFAYRRAVVGHAEPGAGVSGHLSPRQTWPPAEHVDRIANRIFLDPILAGSYPDELLAETKHLSDWAFVADGDLAEIAVPIDSLGVNFYNPATIAAATDELRARPTGRWQNDPERTVTARPSGPAPTWPSRCRWGRRTPAWAGRSGRPA